MRLLFALLIFAPVFSLAQKVDDPELQSLIDAEWAFSNAAKQTSTRDAFIQFLADSAVTFGENPRKGKTHLIKQKADASWLFWQPMYSDIASSGDFGFNTGPWEYRESKSAADAVAFGRFTTVWKKVNGQWQALIDIGISHPKPTAQETFAISQVPLKNVQAVSKSVMQKIIAEEQKFIREFNAKKAKAYETFLSSEAIVYRHQYLPYRKADFLSAKSLPITSFKVLEGDIATSGDLAYVYGRALVDVAKDGKTKKVEGNYMRIWKKEDGKNWKVVLDVVTYL